MGKFKKDKNQSSGSFGGGFNKKKSFGGGNSFSGRDGGAPIKYKATCSECGDSCELPFRPSGDRPVFCSTCFENQGGAPIRTSQDRFSDRGDRGDRRDQRHNNDDRPKFDIVCDKCGQNSQVNFRPTPGKPLFCKACFSKNSNQSPRPSSGNAGSNDVMNQLKMLNDKIDKLIKVLQPTAPAAKSPIKVEKALEAKEEKPASVKKTKVKSAVKKAVGKKKK